MMHHHYILDGKNPIPCDDMREWGKWYEKANRTVAKTSHCEVVVSTVFLSLNHQFDPHGEPILFETLVFGGEFDGEMDRYHTWVAAEVGHAEMCKKVFGCDEVLNADTIE